MPAWIVLPYAAYLRVYEPLSAFPDADGRRWAAYAASTDRPRRTGALAAEVSAAMTALASGAPEMATVMCRRLTSRWQALAALEHAS